MDVDIADETLCQLLLENRFVTLEELHSAVLKARSDNGGIPLTEALVSRGLIEKDQVEALLEMGRIREKPRERKLGNYIIQEKLGVGGMGAVFLARHRSTGEMVALKILPPQTAEATDHLERFMREAQVALKLKHPNIVRGKRLGNHKGINYYVMEHIKGRSLADVLDERPIVFEAEALDIVLQVAKALDYASEFDIVHRDIKPENIAIGDDGVVKLIDLGLARPSIASASVTRSGITLGTPHYISPEQIRGEEIDVRADIYALGITLYEMVVGAPPFDGDSAGVVISKQLTEPIPSATKMNPDVTPGVERLIMKMTFKDRDSRFKDAAELINAVESLLSR